MNDLNSVNMIGRLTSNAFLKYTNGGTAVTSFSLANNESRKKDDQWDSYANFFDCIIWGKYGESMQKHLTKGKEVGISGRLHQERWIDSAGNTNARIRIVVEHINLLRDPRGQKEQQPDQEPPADDVSF